MITAGIDSGIERTKAVVISGAGIAGTGSAISGGAGRNGAAAEALEQALKCAGLRRGQIDKIAATGKGKFDVKFAGDYYTEAVTLAKGAIYENPSTGTAVNLGADEILAVTLKDGGKIGEVVLNQKCSAGVGTFLRTTARLLELSLEEMSKADVSGGDIAVQDGCTVFAQLSALSMLNQGRPAAEVAAAVTKAAAVRAATVLNDIITRTGSQVFCCGGLTLNSAFMHSLAKRSGILCNISKHPEYVCAIGAALAAAE